MLGGQSIQDSPAHFENLSPGPYHVEIDLPRYETQSLDLDVKSGQFTTKDVVLQPLPMFRIPSDPADYYQQVLEEAKTADAASAAGRADDARTTWNEVIDRLSFLQETHPEWEPQLVSDRKTEFQQRLDLLK
jgi:hypothetical protein